LIAARIEALLIPPNAAMMASRFGEPCISRRTSWKKDISECSRLSAHAVPEATITITDYSHVVPKDLNRRAGGGATRCREAARSATI
jgi:hypothetical protein